MTSQLSPWAFTSVSAPDFEQIFENVQKDLITSSMTPSSGAWNELLPTATGTFFLRSLASAVADQQFSLERAQHEAFWDTARRPTSIYAMCRMQGVHIDRIQPASVGVTLTRTIDVATTTLKIPAYTSFQVGPAYYFNRSDIVFPLGGDTVNVTLYQGLMVTETKVSDGSPFQKFIIGRPDFTTSDADLYATVVYSVGSTSTSAVYKKVTDGLWNYGMKDNVFYENTTPDGRVQVQFGNGVYGVVPPAGSLITFSYPVVYATDDKLQSATPLHTSITMKGISDISGVTNTVPSGTIAQRPASFYKAMGPALVNANEIVSSRDDYRAHALKYPGVIDCLVRGQAEINPGDIRWMNGMAVTLVTTSKWGDSDWTAFAAYMSRAGNANLHFHRVDPTIVYVDVVATLRVVNRAILDTAKAVGETAIRKLLAPKAGCLGATLAVTNISQTLIEEVIDPFGGLVTRVDMDSPSRNVACSPTAYAVLQNLDLTVKYDETSQIRVVNGTFVPVQTP